MEPFVYSEVFYFISSFCLIFITLLLIIFLSYLVNIARLVNEVMKIVKKKTHEVSKSLDGFQDDIEDSKLMYWLSLIFSKKKKTTKKRG